MSGYRISDKGVIRIDDDATLLPGDDGWNEYEIWLRSGGVPQPLQPKAKWRNLQHARNEMLAALRIERLKRESIGFAFRGKTIDSDSAARVRLVSAIIAALIARVLSIGFSRDWTTADGSVIQIDGAGMLSLAQALATYDNEIAENAAALKAQILASNMNELLAFDLTAGWPT